MILPHSQTLNFRTTQFCPAPSGPSARDDAWAMVMISEPIRGLGIFSGYELVRVISRSGMGLVYHARSQVSGEDVALKMLPAGWLLHGEVRERFKAEAHTMDSLTHPGVLPVYERGEAHGTLYYTMKLASGGSLAERMGQYDGQWQLIAELVAQVADAVQCAHEHGIVHRDLKPGNILFDEDGKPYVCDFGIAKVLNSTTPLTQAFTQLGTPHYMSPEQFGSGDAELSALSDVWSLGVILYELLAGIRPFNGESPAKIMRTVAEDYPPPLRQVPRDLAVVATTALSKRPADRYASAQDMAADLRRWLSAQPILARPRPLRDIAWPWLRGHRATTTLLSLLLSTTLAAWSLLRDSSRAPEMNLATPAVHSLTAKPRVQSASLAAGVATPGKHVAQLK